MRSLVLAVAFAVFGVALPACGDPPAGAATNASAVSGRSPVGAPDSAASAGASGSASAVTAFAPPRKDLPRETREREVARLLVGDVDAQALPLADTEPGEEFDPLLRRALASRANVTIDEPTADVAGASDQSLAHDAVRGRLARLRRCYVLGLADNPNLMGRVGLTATITAAGKPSRVENTGSDLPDQRVVDCVIAEVGKVAFASPAAAESRLAMRIRFAPGP